MSSTSCSAKLKTLADNYSWPTLIFSCFFAGVVMIVVSNIKTPHTWEWCLFLAASIVLMAAPLLAFFIFWFMGRRNYPENLIAAAEVWVMRFILLICFLMALLIICLAAITSTGWHLPTILTVGCLLMFLTCLATICELLDVNWRTFLHNNWRLILLVSSFTAGLVMVIVCSIKTPHTWEWAVFLAASVVLMVTPLIIVFVAIGFEHANFSENLVWLERLLFFICFLMAALIVCVAAITTTGWGLPTILTVGCLLIVITGLMFYISLGTDTNEDPQRLSSTEYLSVKFRNLVDNSWRHTLLFSCFSAGLVTVVVSNIKTTHTWEWALFLAASIVLMATPPLVVFILIYMERRKYSRNIILTVKVWLEAFLLLIGFLMALLIICVAVITSTGWHLPTILTVGCLLMLLTGLTAYSALLDNNWRTCLRLSWWHILLIFCFLAGLLMAIVCSIKTPHTWEWAVFLAASVVLMAAPIVIFPVYIVLDRKEKLTEAIQVWLERILFFICFLMAALIICVAASTTRGWRLPTILSAGSLLLILSVPMLYISLGKGWRIPKRRQVQFPEAL